MQRKSKNFSLSFIFIIILVFSNSAQSQNHVSGNISGKWTTGNTYWVTGDVAVPDDSTLIIEEGVEVKFIGNWEFKVDGLLQAYGSVQNKITFHTGGGAGTWKKIFFSDSVKTGCILNHCIVKDGGWDNLGNIYIFTNDSNVTISNCEIYNGGSHGIYVQSYLRTSAGDNIVKQCEPKIINNLIHDNHGDGIYVYTYYKNTSSGSANNNTSIGSPPIFNNRIYNNKLNGIKCFTYANGCSWSTRRDANPTIQSNPLIRNNTIYNNYSNGIESVRKTEEYFKGVVVIEASPRIEQNTIYNNEANGIKTTSAYPLISSNIICKSGEYGLKTNTPDSITKVRYNDFWQNASADFSGIEGGLGVNSNVNLIGDSCDIMCNIFFDPGFVNESNYNFHLSYTSKCIDAGDITLPWDEDGSYPDIGAWPYNNGNIINASIDKEIQRVYELLQNYPNPFNPTTTIHYALPQACEVTLKIFNILGKEVITLKDENQPAGYYQTIWHGRDQSGAPVTSGIYFYQLRAGNFVETRKMILSR